MNISPAIKIQFSGHVLRLGAEGGAGPDSDLPPPRASEPSSDDPIDEDRKDAQLFIHKSIVSISLNNASPESSRFPMGANSSAPRSLRPFIGLLQLIPAITPVNPITTLGPGFHDSFLPPEGRQPLNPNFLCRFFLRPSAK